MNDVLKICAEHGLAVETATLDRGVLVLNVANTPSVETLDVVSDVLREHGYRFVSIEFGGTA